MSFPFVWISRLQWIQFSSFAEQKDVPGIGFPDPAALWSEKQSAQSLGGRHC